MIDYKVSCTSHARSIVYTNLYNVVDSNGFDVSTQCITYVIGILLLLNCVNGTYEYITTWTSKHYVQQWMSCNIVLTIRINGCSIFVNHILCLLNYLLLFVDLLGPSVLFVRGWNFEPLPLEMSKHIFLPVKDLMFPWPNQIMLPNQWQRSIHCQLNDLDP